MSGVLATPVTGSVTIYDNEDGVATLMGWSLREADTATGVVVADIHAGVDTTGPVIATVQMQNSAEGGDESQVWFGPQGVRATGGIHLNVVAGTLTGVVYWR